MFAPRSRNGLGLFCILLVVGIGAPGQGSPLEADELEGRAPTAQELQPSVEAAFRRESYAPGQAAALVFFNSARAVTMQVFQSGPEPAGPVGRNEMQGVPVSRVRHVGTVSRGRRAWLPIGNWPSGLYFVRLHSRDGRFGYAPFVVRPRRLGLERVAVVMPTQTWEAYNIRDDDGDGVGNSWYASWSVHTARLARPFLNRGVPPNFRSYDLPFLRWLSQTNRSVDMLADVDLNRMSGRTLARDYDLIVFPGHHEYVTTHEYDAIVRYRDLGGNLMFLSANNFFWQIVRHGDVMERTQRWRDLGRPEAGLIGVQYRGNDRGEHRRPWILRSAPADAWAFAGTQLEPGSTFGSGGIEIDKSAAASPKHLQILAEIPNLFGPGFTAQMTYYETPRGGKVFAAGAFTLAGAMREPTVQQLVTNVWERLSRP
jgi:hypothetical protein